MLISNNVPEKVTPIIYRRKEKDMANYKNNKKLLNKMYKFSPWTEFKFLATATLLTVNINISNNIEVFS
jgi:hypothetical protein